MRFSKKISGILITLFSIILFSFLLANYVFAPMGKEVEYEKVQERTYDKLIRGMAFGREVKGDEEQIYPKVIVFQDEVQFLDESSKIIYQKSLIVTKPKEVGKYFGRQAILSNKGNFVAIHEYTGKFGDVEYIIQEEYTICDDRGGEIYKIKGPPEGTGTLDRLLISDKDGSVVIARFEYGAIDFYTPDGSRKTVPIFGEVGWGKRAGDLNFSGDGEYLAFVVQDIKSPKDRIRTHGSDIWIILFDRNGTELWRNKVDEGQLGNVAISDHGEYLIFNAFSFAGEMPLKKSESRLLESVTINLYDKGGEELSFKDTSLFTFGSFSFSPKADYVALAGGNRVRLLQTKDGSMLWEKRIPEGCRIRQLLFSNDGKYLIVRAKVRSGSEKMGSGHRIIYNKPVFILDIKGDEIWQKDFVELKKTSSKGKFLVFSFPNGYEIYREIQQKADTKGK